VPGRMAAGDNDARCRHACPRRGRRDRDRAKEVGMPPAMTVSTPETPVKTDF
jgi:hypothetical protein